MSFYSRSDLQTPHVLSVPNANNYVTHIPYNPALDPRARPTVTQTNQQQQYYSNSALPQPPSFSNPPNTAVVPPTTNNSYLQSAYSSLNYQNPPQNYATPVQINNFHSGTYQVNAANQYPNYNSNLNSGSQDYPNLQNYPTNVPAVYSASSPPQLVRNSASLPSLTKVYQPTATSVSNFRTKAQPKPLPAPSEQPQSALIGTPVSKRTRFAKYLPTDFMASLVRSEQPPKIEQAPEKEKIVESKEVTPFAVCSDGTSQGFFAYQMENNPMIQLLKQANMEMSKFLLNLSENQAVLLVPSDISLQNFKITEKFLQSHAITIITQSSEGTVVKTLNGILCIIDSGREKINILDLNECANQPEIPGYSFSNTTTSSNGISVPRVQILREGQANFKVPACFGPDPTSTEPIICPIGVILISDIVWSPFDHFIPPPSPVTKKEKKEQEEIADEQEDKLKISECQALYKQKILHVKAKKLRNSIKKFLVNTHKKAPSMEYMELVQTINIFLTQITTSMKLMPLWSSATELEMQIARDNITKSILSKLYNYAFASPAMKAEDEKLHKLIDKLWFVSPEHLDIHSDEWDYSIWESAKKELEAMNNTKAPKDKLNLVLKCSKIIIFLLNSKGGVAGADDFLPHIIFAVIYANPENIQSNIEYIRNFCENDHSMGEAFYYLTILESAVYFINNISAQSLNLTDEELQKYLNDEIPRTNERKSLKKTNPVGEASSPHSSLTESKLEAQEDPLYRSIEDDSSLLSSSIASDVLTDSIEVPISVPLDTNVVDALPATDDIPPPTPLNEEILEALATPPASGSLPSRSIDLLTDLGEYQSVPGNAVLSPRSRYDVENTYVPYNQIELVPHVEPQESSAGWKQVSLSDCDLSILDSIGSPQQVRVEQPPQQYPITPSPQVQLSNPIQPIVEATSETIEKLKTLQDTVNLIADSFAQTKPFTYAHASTNDIRSTDIQLLLEEYRHMVTLLNIVATLKDNK